LPRFPGGRHSTIQLTTQSGTTASDNLTPRASAPQKINMTDLPPHLASTTHPARRTRRHNRRTSHSRNRIGKGRDRIDELVDTLITTQPTRSQRDSTIRTSRFRSRRGGRGRGRLLLLLFLLAVCSDVARRATVPALACRRRTSELEPLDPGAEKKQTLLEGTKGERQRVSNCRRCRAGRWAQARADRTDSTFGLGRAWWVRSVWVDVVRTTS